MYTESGADPESRVHRLVLISKRGVSKNLHNILLSLQHGGLFDKTRTAYDVLSVHIKSHITPPSPAARALQSFMCFSLLIKCCCQTTGQVTLGQREWKSLLGLHDFTWQGVVSLH